MSTGKALAVLLIAGAIAIAAWQAGRTTERNAANRAARTRQPTAAIRDTARQSGIPPTLAGDVPAAPAASEQPPAGQESEATFVLPILEVTERPTHAPAPPPAVPFPPREDRQSDSPARCILLQAHPSSVSAYGIGGEVVQLVVRAQNGCLTNFGSTSFRVAAVGPDGREVASASGSFSEAIPAGGSAETLIAIPTKPSLGLIYRAEVLGY
jgi:hypothetical protein